MNLSIKQVIKLKVYIQKNSYIKNSDGELILCKKSQNRPAVDFSIEEMNILVPIVAATIQDNHYEIREGRSDSNNLKEKKGLGSAITFHGHTYFSTKTVDEILADINY